jgi:hypothetical protein
MRYFYRNSVSNSAYLHCIIVREPTALRYIHQTFPCAISKGEIYVEETNDVAANCETSLATEKQV